MKHLTLCILAALTACLSQSCSKKARTSAPPAAPVVMTTDFQSGFTQNKVQFFIDDRRIFDEKLTTAAVGGLAHTDETVLEGGLHKLRILVDGVQQKDTTLDLQRNLYLGVNLSAGEIRLLISDARWAYE